MMLKIRVHKLDLYETHIGISGCSFSLSNPCGVIKNNFLHQLFCINLLRFSVVTLVQQHIG